MASQPLVSLRPAHFLLLLRGTSETRGSVRRAAAMCEICGISGTTGGSHASEGGVARGALTWREWRMFSGVCFADRPIGQPGGFSRGHAAIIAVKDDGSFRVTG